ncbi:MAG: hypothetical protein HY744_20510 [Deltaproteobacteria bacterium]|nr:hypothetical protein [Deltaproteobacteria bacterium]
MRIATDVRSCRGRALGWASAAVVAAAVGCNALLDIDQIEFRDVEAAAGGAARLDAGGAGGLGGVGGAAGAAGAGGSGGGGECVRDECPGVDTDCRYRACIEDECGLVSASPGKDCTGSFGQGYCNDEGKCAQCLESKHCTGKGTICVQQQCVPESCANAKLDQDKGETDVDCGGDDCPACADGKKCKSAADCQSKICQPEGAGGAQEKLCAPCQDNEDCAEAGGTYCKAEKCVDKKAAGDLCAAAAECASGLCCEAACDGVCEACRADKTGESNGVCAPVEAGEDPDQECSDLGPALCGANGTGCNGDVKAPACKLYAQGTQCQAQSCKDGALSAGGKCDGLGQCVPGQQSACAPYACDAEAKQCLLSCAKNGDCAQGHYCDGTNKCVPVKDKGKSCSQDGECATGHCADGYCCDAACADACSSCNLPGLAGICTLVPFGQNPGGKECAAQQACNGAGTCRTLDGKPCKVGGDCLSGFCADGHCCTAACVGECDACNLGGKLGACTVLAQGAAGSPSCTPYLCNGVGAGCPSHCDVDGDCTANAYCDPDNKDKCEFKKSNGQGCQAPNECTSGICVDGYCCNSACGNACDACDLGGKLGTCSLRAKGTGGIPTCVPYWCNGQSASCPATCSGDGDCVGGYYCDAGSKCVLKKGIGATCGANNQCQNGNCVDGYCCTSACAGGCDACNLGGKLGICTVLAKGAAGSPSCSPYLCDGVNAACPLACLIDSDCVASAYCGGASKCLAKKALGASCILAKECLSMNCADGVCCDQPCVGFCEACKGAWTGGQDGACAPMASIDPDDECLGMPLCDGMGGCKMCGVSPAPPGGPCPAVCDGGCPGGADCLINCGSGECANQTINCPAGFACKVSCTNTSSCTGATINCPA